MNSGSGDQELRWTFGDVTVDERSHELRIAGELVALEPKPFRVLMFLVRHCGEVVTKEELNAALWDSRPQSDSVITRHISVLRNALGSVGHQAIQTAHGFGYRFAAQVRAEPAPHAARPVFRFEVGDAVSSRPHWKLQERLGTGGYGEAWLARHDLSGQQRVFKFAVDARALTALKREITLHRVLRESLGASAPVPHLSDWDLEHTPCFVEIEYIPGRDLETWIRNNGGFAALSHDARIDLVAQIAEAVGAAHNAGVLHKDIKPGNILVEGVDGKPRIRLADFGSGSMLDPGALRARGIVGMGFTKSVHDLGGSALYVAPETVGGHMPTVRADVYALGIVLYQMLIGDFRRPLAQGWDLDISAELLREDIAAACAGAPERRMESAALLASRLKTLPARTKRRAVERAATARAAAIQHAKTELTRARAFVATLAALLFLSFLAVGAALKAKNQAVAATQNAEAVTAFLIDDVLKVERAVDRPQGNSYASSLDRAAQQVTARLGETGAAARVHWLLGRRYHEMQQIDKAIGEYHRAWTLFVRLYGPEANDSLLARERLATVFADATRHVEAKQHRHWLVSHWQKHPASDTLAIVWMLRLARIGLATGLTQEPEAELKAAINNLRNARQITPGTADVLKQWLGVELLGDSQVLPLAEAYAWDGLGGMLGEIKNEFREGERAARNALEGYTQVLGADSELVAFTRVRLGAIQAQMGGDLSQAVAMLNEGKRFYDAWLPAGHAFKAIPTYWSALAHFENLDFPRASELINDAIVNCSQCPLRFELAFKELRGRIRLAAGELDLALKDLDEALSQYGKRGGIQTVTDGWSRAALAETYLRRNQPDLAQKALAEVNRDSYRLLPNHPALGEVLRVEALMLARAGMHAASIASASRAMEINQITYGRRHWRTVRTARQLRELSRKRP